MPKGVYTRNTELRPQTFRDCDHCRQRFGPLDRLSRRFCSTSCWYAKRRAGGRAPRAKPTREARNAQRTLKYHVDVGHITRPSVCEECEAHGVKIEGAHFDYAEPLRVRWLCVSCHRRWDNADPKGGIQRRENLTGGKAELVEQEEST